MSNDTKFPEANWDTYGHTPLDYNYGDVNDWFKRCLADRPRIMTKDNRYNKYFYNQYKVWYKKYFSQFEVA